MTTRSVWIRFGNFLRHPGRHLRFRLNGRNPRGEDKQAITTRVVNPVQQTLLMMEQGLGRMSQLLDGINEHLSSQADRNRQLQQVLERIPLAMRELPRYCDRQQQTLQTIAEHVAVQRQTQDKLAKVMQAFPETVRAQNNTLSAISNQLEMSAEADLQLVESLRKVGGAISELKSSTESQIQTLEAMRQAIVQSERRTNESLRRQNKRMNALLTATIVVSVLSIAAVAATAIYVLGR